jgi:hypothetical protein
MQHGKGSIPPLYLARAKEKEKRKSRGKHGDDEE